MAVACVIFKIEIKAFTFPLFFGVITADTFKVETVTNNLSISILTY